MELNNPGHFCVIYHGQQVDSTPGAQTPMHGGRNYPPLDDILPPPAEDMIDNTGEKSDNDAEMWCPIPRCFPTTKIGFQTFRWKHQSSIIRQHQYLKVIRNCALALFADCEQRVVADQDVAWLREHDHIVNPPAAGPLCNGRHTFCCPAA